MDPNETIKHAPELMTGGAALAGVLRLTDVVKAMLGPATAEVAERIHDEVRLYRFGRQLECLKKAEKMAIDAGFTPKAVPIKLLFPLLEGASLEENEDLHTMWAALLTNAASPENAKLVRPGFIAVLKQMSPDEAACLQWLSEPPETSDECAAQRIPLVRALLDDRNRLSVCMQGLKSAWLVERQRYNILTIRGQDFLQACSPPKPKS